MSIIIVGAGGNAKKIIDIFLQTSIDFLGFISSEKEGMIIHDYPILGHIEDVVTLKEKYGVAEAVISIGDNFIRKQISGILMKHNIDLINVIHPSVILSPSAEMGKGNVVMANSVIQANAQLGNCCLIDTHSIIEHDSSIGNFSSIAPGGIICGNVHVGDVSAIGAGAVVLEKRRVGNHCVIGGNSLVNRSIPDYSLAFGIPAKLIRKREPGETYLE